MWYGLRIQQFESWNVRVGPGRLYKAMQTKYAGDCIQVIEELIVNGRVVWLRLKPDGYSSEDLWVKMRSRGEGWFPCNELPHHKRNHATKDMCDSKQERRNSSTHQRIKLKPR